MTQLVDPSDIEAIVGRERDQSEHWGRSRPSDMSFYIMHSFDCLDSVIDLRDCEYSRGLDKSLDNDLWSAGVRGPVQLEVIDDGKLIVV